MFPVTHFVKNILKQPRGGYLPPKMFEKTQLDDGIELNNKNDVSPTLIGLAVDYLTRLSTGCNVEKAFEISFRGALACDKLFQSKHEHFDDACQMSADINSSLDDLTIENAINLVQFDTYYRANPQVSINYPPQIYLVSDETISDVRTMVKRSLTFFEKYGDKVLDGITFDGAYTMVISSGDADFATQDTLWDFKTTSKDITNKHTAQILIYYLLGTHSKHKEFFKQLKKIGFYNPKLNVVYTLDIDKIPQEVIDAVSKEILLKDN